MFDPITISAGNSTERMISRTLLQFRKSQVFIDFIAAMASEVQSLLEASIQVIKQRCPAEAVGNQLDGIGRIVGQLRLLLGFDTIAWFTPDRLLQGPDQVPVWVTNAPLSGDVAADDTFFRQLIEAKVTRNFVRFASIPEIKQFFRQSFNLEISFVRIDTMTIQVIVPDETSFNVTSLLERSWDIGGAEHIYFLPLAAGVHVSSVLRLSEYLDSSSS